MISDSGLLFCGPPCRPTLKKTVQCCVSLPTHPQVKPRFHLARLDSTRSTLSSKSRRTRRAWRVCRASRVRRVERVELCCSTSSTQPKFMGSTRRTCRVESSQVEFGLKQTVAGPKSLLIPTLKTRGTADALHCTSFSAGRYAMPIACNAPTDLPPMSKTQ